MTPPRIELSREDIAGVVTAFYIRARQDEVLGPIFAKHVDNWSEHEEKITRFWANAILFEGSYDGNPMMAHMKAGNVHSAHFENWLALFDEVLVAMVAQPQRDQWSNLVHRIGRGLSFGLSDTARPRGAVPRF